MPQEVRLQLTDPGALVRIANKIRTTDLRRWDRGFQVPWRQWSLFVLPDLTLDVFPRRVEGTRTGGVLPGPDLPLGAVPEGSQADPTLPLAPGLRGRGRRGVPGGAGDGRVQEGEEEVTAPEPTAATERQLLAAVEEDAADHARKAVLADYYEELGDARAEPWRWLAAKGVYPDLDSGLTTPVYWWNHPEVWKGRHDRCPRHAFLPLALHRKLLGRGKGGIKCWARMRGLERVVLAWPSLSPQEKAECWAWNP